MVDILERLAYATGAGDSVAAVKAGGTSAFDSLALVYHKDVKDNSGEAYPTTPGHFTAISCVADPVLP